MTVAGQSVNVTQAGASSPPPPPPPGPVTASWQVATGANDVNEVNNALTTNATAVWLGNAGSTSTSFAGFRFVGVAIPAGAIISSAHLEVTSASDQWIGIQFLMAADLTGNSAAFSTSARPSQRTQTTAKVNHNTNVRWVPNTVYSLEEIKTVIQEVVARADWQSGNSLTVILKGTGSGTWARKFVRSFEAGASTAPRLVVTYTMP